MQQFSRYDVGGAKDIPTLVTVAAPRSPRLKLTHFRHKEVLPGRILLGRAGAWFGFRAPVVFLMSFPRSETMSRYVCELTSLLGDLRARYGDDDDSVRQIQRELAAVEARESGHRQLFALGRNCPLSASSRHSWDGYSSLLHSSQRPEPLASDPRAGQAT
jgi:hypothetical protein